MNLKAWVLFLGVVMGPQVFAVENCIKFAPSYGDAAETVEFKQVGCESLTITRTTPTTRESVTFATGYLWNFTDQAIEFSGKSSLSYKAELGVQRVMLFLAPSNSLDNYRDGETLTMIVYEPNFYTGELQVERVEYTGFLGTELSRSEYRLAPASN